VAEEVRIDPLRDAGREGILFDELPNAPRRVRPVPIRFKEIPCALGPLPFHILGKLPPETVRKEHVAVLLALPLGNPHLAGLEIDICEAELDEFGIPDAGK
jgi:hypothetical protein